MADFLIIVGIPLAAYGLLIAGIEYFSRRAGRTETRARGTAAAARPARPVDPVAHADAMHRINARVMPYQPQHAIGKPRLHKQPWLTDQQPVYREEPFTYGEKSVADVLEAERLNSVMQP
jgi:hypothetical protein